MLLFLLVSVKVSGHSSPLQRIISRISNTLTNKVLMLPNRIRNKHGCSRTDAKCDMMLYYVEKQERLPSGQVSTVKIASIAATLPTNWMDWCIT